jgi:hypothetical protein
MKSLTSEHPLKISSSTCFFPAPYLAEPDHCSLTEILLVIPEAEGVRCLAVAEMVEQMCNFGRNPL